MNILILNWRDIKHPLAGGAEYMLWEHAHYWKKKGAKVTWIASGFVNGKKEEVIDGITVKRFGSHYTVHLQIFIFALQGKLSQFDTVIDCFHFLPFFAPLLFPKKKVIALIHEIAGSVWFQNLFFPFAIIGYLVEPFFFLPYRKRKFITVSDSTKEELMKVGIPSKNISVIHNGITLPKKIPTGQKTPYPSLLFLNRISADKGFVDALKVYQIVKEKIPTVRFCIAGKEQKKGIVEHLLKKLSDKNISYKGYVTEEKKWQLLKNSWLLLHPSTKEGWGLTVIEANSMGTPVVGYNVAGLKDSIKHNKTGILTEPTSEDMAKSVSTLLTTKSKLDLFSKQAKDWAKRFRWAESIKKSWEVIQK